MAEMKQLNSVLQSIISLFDRLLAVETKKIDAIALNDIDRLEEYMREEQAATMELRGLDNKREETQRALGFEDYTMRQIIAELPEGEEKEDLLDLFERLEDKTEELNVAVDCSKKFIELHLRSIDFLLAQANEENREQQDAPYKQTGERVEEDGGTPRFESKKV